METIPLSNPNLKAENNQISDSITQIYTVNLVDQFLKWERSYVIKLFHSTDTTLLLTTYFTLLLTTVTNLRVCSCIIWCTILQK